MTENEAYMRMALRDIEGRISAFDADCKAEKFTDTGEAWELFEHIQAACQRMLALEGTVTS